MPQPKKHADSNIYKWADKKQNRMAIQEKDYKEKALKKMNMDKAEKEDLAQQQANVY